ncbi:MAG: alpha/beta fold hydrolase [Candidatus Rokuibacteriota bacterium]
MPEVRLHRGALDGLALHYITEGRGPDVVLVHGLGGFAASWRPTMDALASRATVHALDLPGFGRSAKPRSRYDLGFFAGALDGFLDAIGVGHASLVGHSLGGAVVLTQALLRPTRVDRVALLGALLPGFAYRLSPLFRLLSVRGLGEALAACGGPPALYRSALARCFHRPDPDTVAFLVDCDYATRTAWEARLAWLGTLRGVRDDFERRGADYRRAVGTLALPVLAIHGLQDPVVPAAHCREVAAVLSRAEVRWIDACGHFPQLEHPVTVNEWLGEFLGVPSTPR